MNLIEIALKAHAEHKAEAPRQAARMLEEARTEFLVMARGCVRLKLGRDFDALQWQYTCGPDLPEEIEQATASLEPERPEYLRYRVDHGKESVALELVQPCAACGHDRITAVHSVVDLGQLLAGSGES